LSKNGVASHDHILLMYFPENFRDKVVFATLNSQEIVTKMHNQDFAKDFLSLSVRYGYELDGIDPTSVIIPLPLSDKEKTKTKTKIQNQKSTARSKKSNQTIDESLYKEPFKQFMNSRANFIPEAGLQ
jgi:hypothetical protein